VVVLFMTYSDRMHSTNIKIGVLFLCIVCILGALISSGCVVKVVYMYLVDFLMV
jgi:hypothetical protein